MGKSPRFAQNGEVTSDTALSHGAPAPGRQRPEEILAQTLSAPSHPEATDGWSSRGRRLFLIALAVAGIVLVVAGLLVTKELGPGPGNPAPLETGPGNGLANQLLQSSNGDQPASPATPNIAIPLPSTPTTGPARPTTHEPTLAPPAESQPTRDTTHRTTPRSRRSPPRSAIREPTSSAGARWRPAPTRTRPTRLPDRPRATGAAGRAPQTDPRTLLPTPPTRRSPRAALTAPPVLWSTPS